MRGGQKRPRGTPAAQPSVPSGAGAPPERTGSAVAAAKRRRTEAPPPQPDPAAKAAAPRSAATRPAAKAKAGADGAAEQPHRAGSAAAPRRSGSRAQGAPGNPPSDLGPLRRSSSAPLKRSSSARQGALQRSGTAPPLQRNGSAQCGAPTDGVQPLLRRTSSRRQAPPCPDPVPETPQSRALAALLRCPQWSDALQAEFKKQYFVDLAAFLASRREQGDVFPPAGEEFAAFNATPLSAVRVVVVGQDPYHNNGQAHGLCFSVRPGVPLPPSLKNIFAELERDIRGWVAPEHGDLTAWARQGVLLINSTLTVDAHEPNSHSKSGWQHFTDAAIEVVSRLSEHVVFLLWGGFAQRKCAFIDREKHTVIETAHPSPLSVTKWRGCRCFSQCSAALAARGGEPIDWALR